MLKKYTFKEILWNTYDLYMEASRIMIKFLGFLIFLVFIGVFYDLDISSIVGLSHPCSVSDLYVGCVILFLFYYAFHFLLSRIKYLKIDR